MTAYVTIPNSDVDQDSPVTVALMTALRDNPTAIADGGGGPVLGLTLLSAVTLANDASVDFTTFDSTRYQSYLFTFSNIVGSSVGIFNMVTSSDGGTTFDTTATDYTTAIDKNGTYATGVNTWVQLVSTMSNIATRGSSGSIELFSPDEANRTHVTGTFITDTGATPDAYSINGVRNSAGVVDAVRFKSNIGNLSTGVITMYGRGRV